MVAPDLVPTSSSPNSSLYSAESPANSQAQASPSQYYFLSPAQASSSVQEIESNFCEFITAENYKEFEQDVFTNYSASAVLETCPFLDEIIESVKTEIRQEQACSPSSSVRSSLSPSVVPTLTLSAEQPVKFMGDDGKEYMVVLQPVEETSKKALKRKMSGAEETVKSKRAPGVSLVNMSEDEISERKKEQNRAAAQRYREKMKSSKQNEVEERKTLTDRNAYLRVEAARLEKEIASLRSFIFDRVSS